MKLDKKVMRKDREMLSDSYSEKMKQYSDKQREIVFATLGSFLGVVEGLKGFCHSDVNNLPLKSTKIILQRLLSISAEYFYKRDLLATEYLSIEEKQKTDAEKTP